MKRPIAAVGSLSAAAFADIQSCNGRYKALRAVMGAMGAMGAVSAVGGTVGGAVCCCRHGASSLNGIMRLLAS